jgi:hypothetical protein
MGFKHWYQGLEIIFMFAVVIGFPCIFTVLFGSKMINDLGNFPSKSAQIQASATWKMLIVEVLSFVLLMLLNAFLVNIQSE